RLAEYLRGTDRGPPEADAFPDHPGAAEQYRQACEGHAGVDPVEHRRHQYGPFRRGQWGGFRSRFAPKGCRHYEYHEPGRAAQWEGGDCNGAGRWVYVDGEYAQLGAGLWNQNPECIFIRQFNPFEPSIPRYQETAASRHLWVIVSHRFFPTSYQIVSPVAGPAGLQVVIRGANFSPNAASDLVRFGVSQAPVVSGAQPHFLLADKRFVPRYGDDLW